MKSSVKTWLARALCATWVAAAAGGFVILARHDAEAGETSSAPRTWPAVSSIPRRADRATLVVFVHPRCPCSRATIRELERLLARVGDRVHAVAVFVRPAGMGKGSEEGALLDSARGIRALEIVVDADGSEAKRFGVATSGATFLYAPSGERLFTGGLTASRGHEGESAGTIAIERLLGGLASKTPSASPVFGCALHDPEGQSR